MNHRTWNIKYKSRTERKNPEDFSASAPCSMLHVSCSAGFSIIETIVAIAILSIAIVAPMTLAQRGLNGAMYARDQVTAFYLAQEAVEFIRNTRDNNNFEGRSGGNLWLSGLDGVSSCKEPMVCGVDVTSTSNNFLDCNAEKINNCSLTFDSSSGTYGSGPGAGTVYTRTFQVKPFAVDPPHAVDLMVTVTWKSGRISKELKVTEKIFDWYPRPAP